MLAGRILRAHGLRGALLLKADDYIMDALLPGTRVVLRRDGDELLSAAVDQLKRRHDDALLKLVGVKDRSAAEPLARSDAWIPEDCLPDVEDDAYYENDILGATVEDSAGLVLGLVTEVIQTGANDVWKVEGPEVTALIPVVKSVVTSIDSETGRVVVNREGLDFSRGGEDSA